MRTMLKYPFTKVGAHCAECGHVGNLSLAYLQFLPSAEKTAWLEAHAHECWGVHQWPLFLCHYGT